MKIRFKPGLKRALESLYSTYSTEFIDTDPVIFVHRYEEFRDREIAAILASALAFGSVAHIKRSVGDVLCRMKGKPYAYVSRINPTRTRKDFDSFVHRFVRGIDVACLLYFLNQVYRSYGSLYALFLERYSASAETTEAGLSRFVKTIYSQDCEPFYRSGVLPKDARVRYLLSSPERGSACKRMNMFLRWMVRRPDGIDFGLWKDVSPAQLVIPLDTHVSRISRRIGLTRKRVSNWKTALEVTDSLRSFDKRDPVKYDFAFSRLGILGVCGSRRNDEENCPLKGVCNCTGNSDV